MKKKCYHLTSVMHRLGPLVLKLCSCIACVINHISVLIFFILMSQVMVSFNFASDLIQKTSALQFISALTSLPTAPKSPLIYHVPINMKSHVCSKQKTPITAYNPSNPTALNGDLDTQRGSSDFHSTVPATNGKTDAISDQIKNEKISSETLREGEAKGITMSAHRDI